MAKKQRKKMKTVHKEDLKAAMQNAMAKHGQELSQPDPGTSGYGASGGQGGFGDGFSSPHPGAQQLLGSLGPGAMEAQQ